MQLQWVEDQLSALLAERAVSTIEVSTSNHLDDQAKLPKRASRSGQTTLKDIRSNRSDKLAPRSNHDKKKSKLQQILRLVQSVHQEYQKLLEGKHRAVDDSPRFSQIMVTVKIKSLTTVTCQCCSAQKQPIV